MPIGPSSLIVLPFEGPPRVVMDALNDSEGARLVDWVEAKGYDELIIRANQLAAEEPAA